MPARNSILVNAPPDKMAIIRQAVTALDVPAEPEGSLLASISRMHTYRLAALDPEPLVKSLQSLGDLDPRTQLEVDKQNHAIIAYCPAADHVMIQMLIDKLDGSGAEVRRDPAAAAGGRRRGRHHPVHDGRRGEEGEQHQKLLPLGLPPVIARRTEQKDKFRVDADIEHNRLLLWANEIEMTR